MTLYEGRESTYTMEKAPYQVRVFTRVVALQQSGEKYVAIDTSVRKDALTGGTFLPEFSMHPNGIEGTPHPVSASPAPLTAVIHWPPVPFAGAYVMRVVRRETPPGGRVTLVTIAQPIVRDSLVTFTEGNEGQYRYAVQVRYDFPNWSAPGDTLHQTATDSIPVAGKVDGGFFSCMP